MKSYTIIIVTFLFHLLLNSQNNNEKELLILSIEKIDTTKIYVIKAIDNEYNSFKIISVDDNDNKKCICKKIEENLRYKLSLSSVFTGISLGNRLTKYSIYGKTIMSEPENGFFDLYNTTDLNGLCLISK